MSTHAYTAAGPRSGRDLRPGAAGALRIAALCALGAAIVWVFAELVPAAQVRDAILLRHFTLLSGPHVDTAANTLLDVLSPLPLACWGVALVLFSLSRGLRREALAVALVVGLAPVSAEVLKPLLAHAHASAGTVHIGPASWPSGHATAALALALCATLLAPPRARVTVALAGAAFALAVGCALLIQAWHMPSDVIGGYLVAALWTALAVAGLRAAERRWPRTPQPEDDPCAPGSHNGSEPSAPRSAFAARLRMNSRSESRFR
jgi:membrane-associated phospholipid phosphatase